MPSAQSISASVRCPRQPLPTGGFITYPHFSGLEPQLLAGLAGPALEHFAALPQISKVEFKTRGHDYASGLSERLHSLGLIAQEHESIMIVPQQHCSATKPPRQDWNCDA